MDYVEIIPLDIQYNGISYAGDNLNIRNLPKYAGKHIIPRLSAPSPEELYTIFYNLSKIHDEILGVFVSSHLNPLFTNAEKALKTIGEKKRIRIIDSQNTAIGLGFLVETAVKAIFQQASLNEIERLVCSLIPHVYMVLCIPGLSYLHYNGFLDIAQATTGEMLDILAAFSLEEGKLTPIEKMRNLRHTQDYFQEFLREFEHLQYISLLQSAPPKIQAARLLRDHSNDSFPDTPFAEYKINAALATLFGPRTIGVTAIETP